MGPLCPCLDQGLVQQPDRRLLPQRRMTAQLAVTALPTAVQAAADGRRGGPLGPQLAGPGLPGRPDRRRAEGSKGRVASARDNAAMESWQALLQSNVLDRRRWRTRDELHEAVVFAIEHTFAAADGSERSAS